MCVFADTAGTVGDSFKLHNVRIRELVMPKSMGYGRARRTRHITMWYILVTSSARPAFQGSCGKTLAASIYIYC